MILLYIQLRVRICPGGTEVKLILVFIFKLCNFDSSGSFSPDDPQL